MAGAEGTALGVSTIGSVGPLQSANKGHARRFSPQPETLQSGYTKRGAPEGCYLGVVCRDRNTLSELQSGGPQGRRRQLTKLFAIFARKVAQMPEPALKRRVFYTCGSVLKFLARGHQPLPAQVAMQFHIPGAERRILQGTS